MLFFKNKIDANTPPPKPNPVLINVFDKTTSHLSFNKFWEAVEGTSSCGLISVDMTSNFSKRLVS